MKLFKTSGSFFTMLLILLLFACNEPASTSGENERDTTPITASRDTSSMPAYNPEMDAYEMDGADIEKLGDTLDIKMYVATIKPGDSAAMHTDPDHTVYVLQGGKLAIIFPDMPQRITEVETGTGFISGPSTHAVKNVGSTTVKLLVADIYRPRNK